MSGNTPSWRNQPDAANSANIRADNTWGKPATAWDNASSQPFQQQPTRPITWNEPAQPPVAVPVQQTGPSSVNPASGWNAPASFQTPIGSSRTSTVYNDPQSSSRTASRLTPSEAYGTASYSSGAAAGANSAAAYPAGANQNTGGTAGTYLGAPSASGYPNATPVGNYSSGSQYAAPVNNYSGGSSARGAQGNYSTWGGNNTYSAAAPSSANGAGYYGAPSAGGATTPTTESGTARFEGGIDKTTVRTTYDSTGSSIR